MMRDEETDAYPTDTTVNESQATMNDWRCTGALRKSVPFPTPHGPLLLMATLTAPARAAGGTQRTVFASTNIAETAPKRQRSDPEKTKPSPATVTTAARKRTNIRCFQTRHLGQ